MKQVAVIGVGNMGRNHARVYSEIEGVDLVAVSDSDEPQAKSVADEFSCKSYYDYRKMLKEEQIDAVSIAVPTNLHHRVALDCIKAGVHVLVEKPIADTIEASREMVEESRAAGVVLTVGHVERFNPGVTRLKELIDDGVLGEITSINARRVGIYPPSLGDANVVLDLAVHDIDIFNYLLDRGPVDVFSRAGDALKSGRDDHAIITLGYGEVSCAVQVNWITPVKVREIAVTGTKGYAELNYITQGLRVYESNYERAYDSFGDFVVKFGAPHEMEVEVEKTEPLKEELKVFIGSVKKDKRPLVTGEEAILALTVSQKAIESYRKNRLVDI